MIPTLELARKVIAEQFPEYIHLDVWEVAKQGHDNRSYRLGDKMLIRMPTAESYALNVSKEQELLPKLAKCLSVCIPVPIRMGSPSQIYPYPFSIYKWLPGQSINLLNLTLGEKEDLAFDLAKFLKELWVIRDISGGGPGQHNWWRGDHVSIYDKSVRQQIAKLSGIIDGARAIALWKQACATKWNKPLVWVHGDFAVGNMLFCNGRLSAIIDFGGVAIGDPACDLVIAWVYLFGKSREIFMQELEIDCGTWLRARAWALWKATFELCQIADKNCSEAFAQRSIIDEVL